MWKLNEQKPAIHLERSESQGSGGTTCWVCWECLAGRMNSSWT